MRIAAITSGLLLALSACASNPREGPPTTATGQTRVPMTVDLASGSYSVDLVRDDQITTGWIDAPVDDAWRHLLDVYEALGFEVRDLTEYIPAERRVTVAVPRMRRLADQRLSTFLDCGYSMTSPKADQGHVRVFLSTWLEPKEGGTTVTTRFEAAARDTGTSTAAVPCSSRGKLEQLIADQLLLRIVRESLGD